MKNKVKFFFVKHQKIHNKKHFDKQIIFIFDLENRQKN